MLAPLKDFKKAADGPFSDGSRQPSLATEHCVADPGCLSRIPDMPHCVSASFLMRIRIQFFTSMRIRTLLLNEVMRICDRWSTDPPGLHLRLQAPPLWLHLHGPLWLHFKPLKPISFYFNADPDSNSAFHSNADPDPLSQNTINANPYPPPCRILIISIQDPKTKKRGRKIN